MDRNDGIKRSDGCEREHVYMDLNDRVKLVTEPRKYGLGQTLSIGIFVGNIVSLRMELKLMYIKLRKILNRLR